MTPDMLITDAPTPSTADGAHTHTRLPRPDMRHDLGPPEFPVPPTHANATRAIDAALAPPATRTTERDSRLLAAAIEAGAGGQALSVLERIDPAGLDAHDRVRYLQAVTACAAWLEAFQSMAVVGVAGPSGGWVSAEIEQTVAREVTELTADGTSARDRERIATHARDEAWEVRERAVTLEVSMAMRVSPRTAGRRIEGARFLLESLRPAIGEALAGRWGYGHLRVAEKELANVPAPLREQIFADVLPYAAIDHPRRLTDRIRKSLARRDAAGSAERMRERAERRDVTLWNLPDGQARLAATGPFQRITDLYRSLTELARARQRVVDAARIPGESVPSQEMTDRRLGALRVEVLIEAVRRLVAAMDAEDRGDTEDRGGAADATNGVVHSDTHSAAGNLAEAGMRQSVDHTSACVVGTQRTEPDPWTGPRANGPGSRPKQQAAVIVDLATALHLADEPGYLPGYGWIPAPIAREILGDCDRWRRWLVDDKSRKLIEAGSTRYRPSQALRDLVGGRDLTCTADTCTRPAAEVQLDHAIDFDGANTTPGNVHGVCGPDHLVITAGHFVIDSDADGNLSWVSTATGHAYPSHPDLLHERPAARDAEEGGAS